LQRRRLALRLKQICNQSINNQVFVVQLGIFTTLSIK
jgi:hypothetical protein